MQKKSSSKASVSEIPLVAHLVELRDRLLRAVMAVAILFISLIYFANDLYEMIAAPLMAHLPADSSMIATEVASPFFTPFKLTLVMSIFLAMPFILYQFWGFVAPGLYRREKRMMFPLIASSAALFYLGAAFAYFAVFPLVFGFFTSVAPDGVAIMTDISKYLDFVLKLFFAFGLAFEVPIVTIVLVWAGISSPDSLRKKRPYIIVGVFVFAMLLTPPDAISQTMLAVPMLLLFEAGLYFSKYFYNPADEDSGADDVMDKDESPEPPKPAASTGEQQSFYESQDSSSESNQEMTQQNPDPLNKQDK